MQCGRGKETFDVISGAKISTIQSKSQILIGFLKCGSNNPIFTRSTIINRKIKGHAIAGKRRILFSSVHVVVLCAFTIITIKIDSPRTVQELSTVESSWTVI